MSEVPVRGRPDTMVMGLFTFCSQAGPGRDDSPILYCYTARSRLIAYR